MSMGYGYDMVLLPPRALGDRDYELSQPGRVVRRMRRRAHRQARRNRRRCLPPCEEPSSSSGSQPAAAADLLVEGMSSLSLAGNTFKHHCRRSMKSSKPQPSKEPHTPSGPAAALPHELFPHGLHNAAKTISSSVSTDLGAYKDLLGHHLRSTVDLVTSAPNFE